MGRKHLRCPDCKKKGVTLRLRSAGEDHYACRYCTFNAFTEADTNFDREELRRLGSVNTPGDVIGVVADAINEKEKRSE